MQEEEKELIKAGADAVMRPFSELLLKLFGPSFEQIGGRWGDFWKNWREKRARDFVSKLERIQRERNLQLREVPTKLLQAVFDNASLEDNDELQTLWANLLLNASDARELNLVSIVFPDILKDLGSREVKFLDALYRDANERLQGHPLIEEIAQMPYDRSELMELYAAAGLSRAGNIANPSPEELQNPDLKRDREEYWLMLDTIRRHDVVREVTYSDPMGWDGEPGSAPLRTQFHVTTLGAAFVKACRPPKAQ